MNKTSSFGLRLIDTTTGYTIQLIYTRRIWAIAWLLFFSFFTFEMYSIRNTVNNIVINLYGDRR